MQASENGIQTTKKYTAKAERSGKTETNRNNSKEKKNFTARPFFQIYKQEIVIY